MRIHIGRSHPRRLRRQGDNLVRGVGEPVRTLAVDPEFHSDRIDREQVGAATIAQINKTRHAGLARESNRLGKRSRWLTARPAFAGSSSSRAVVVIRFENALCYLPGLVKIRNAFWFWSFTTRSLTPSPFRSLTSHCSIGSGQLESEVRFRAEPGLRNGRNRPRSHPCGLWPANPSCRRR